MQIEPIITSMLEKGFQCVIRPIGNRKQVVFLLADQIINIDAPAPSISLGVAVELAAERILEHA
jgi:hypothetical protein